MTDHALAHAKRYIEMLDLRLMSGDIGLTDYRRKIDAIMAWLIAEVVPPAEPEPPAEEQDTCPTALLTSPFMALEPSGS